MPRRRLNDLLLELHDELERAAPLDPSTRDDLLELAEELRETAAFDGGRPAESGLQGRVQEAVHRFEASHPGLARVLANVIDTLALYGI